MANIYASKLRLLAVRRNKNTKHAFGLGVKKENAVSSKALNQMRAEEIMRDKYMNVSCQCNVAAVTANANFRCLSKNTEG